MKQFLPAPFRWFAACLTAALLTVAALPASAAQQTYYPPEFGSWSLVTPFTNQAAALADVTNNSLKRPLDVPANSTLVFQATLGGQNIGTSNVTFYFNGTLDGTYWTKSFPFQMTGASSGSNANTVLMFLGTNIGARYISLDKITTTSTNVIVISNMSFVAFPPAQGAARSPTP